MQPSSEPFSPFDGWSYSLLLGYYLGDGCVASTGTSYQLRVILDGLYPGVIDDCVMAVTLSLRKEVNVRVRPRRTDRGVIVEAAYKNWPEALPQHGPGRKHHRPIVLADWQRSIVDRHPRPFLRGLIHSDGCRTVNRFKTRLPSGRVAEYAYPATSSPTSPPTSAASSASTASGSEFAGRSRTRATSRCRTVTASRCSIPS